MQGMNNEGYLSMVSIFESLETGGTGGAFNQCVLPFNKLSVPERRLDRWGNLNMVSS